MTRAGHGHSDKKAEPSADVSPSTTTITTSSQPEPGPVPEKGLVGMSKLKREISIQDQSSRMPLRKVLIVYLGVGQWNMNLTWKNKLKYRLRDHPLAHGPNVRLYRCTGHRHRSRRQ